MRGGRPRPVDGLVTMAGRGLLPTGSTPFPFRHFTVALAAPRVSE